MAFTLFSRRAAAATLVILLGCGGGGDGDPATLEFQAQSGDTALPGATRTARVRVTDAARAPVAGVRVEFVPSSGSGSVSPGFALTDDSGIARTAWTLAAAGGEQSLEARAPGLAPALLGVSAVAVGFHATGLRAAASQNIRCASDSQVTLMPVDLCTRPLTELKIEFRGTLHRSGMGHADFVLRCADREVSLASLLGSNARTVTVTWLDGEPATAVVDGANAGSVTTAMLPTLHPGSVTLRAFACGADNFHFADLSVSEISFWAR